MARVKVFCSHRSTDKPAVELFARKLRDKGIDAWLDKWEIQAGGDDFVEQINRGLRECDVGLVFLSRDSATGNWIGAEINSLIVDMVEGNKPIIPVMIDDDAEIPALLQPVTRRGIDEFDEIVDAILNRTEKPKLGPPPGAKNLRRLQIELRGPASGPLDVIAMLDGQLLAETKDVALPSAFEADSHLKLGFTDRGLSRWQELVQIFEAKSMAEPDRADYQRDLSVSYERLGDLLSALGQGEEARRYYQDSLEIRQRLAESEPDRADYQRDLVVSLIRVADLEPENSEACLRRAVQVLETLKKQGRQVEDAEGIMAYLMERLGQSGGE